jgi:hypothetical protein
MRALPAIFAATLIALIVAASALVTSHFNDRQWPDAPRPDISTRVVARDQPHVVAHRVADTPGQPPFDGAARQGRRAAARRADRVRDDRHAATSRGDVRSGQRGSNGNADGRSDGSIGTAPATQPLDAAPQQTAEPAVPGPAPAEAAPDVVDAALDVVHQARPEPVAPAEHAPGSDTGTTAPADPQPPVDPAPAAPGARPRGSLRDLLGLLP